MCFLKNTSVKAFDDALKFTNSLHLVFPTIFIKLCLKYNANIFLQQICILQTFQILTYTLKTLFVDERLKVKVFFLGYGLHLQKKKPNVKVSNDSSKWKWKMVKGTKPMHFSIVLLSYFLLSNNGWSANVELMLLDSNVISHNDYFIFVKSHNLLNCNLLFYAWEKEWS